MQHWQETLPFDFSHPVIREIFTERALFFDIETTGFSPARTSLYLIGCASRKGDRLIVDQFFAAQPAEEAEILAAFSGLLAAYETVITYNGIGFDIPYLRAKCHTYRLPDPFASCDCIDLYKEVSPLRPLLRLPSLKQKSLEQFLGIGREDLYHGGELIGIYHSYVESPREDALHLLKQHNYEDILGMPGLLPILSYARIFDGGFTVASLRAGQSVSLQSAPERELRFTLRNDCSVPVPVSCSQEDFHLTAEGAETALTVRLFTGELKYFFPDYKNYFYLPEEDRAVPKTLAGAIGKENRQNAKASTCYAKKTAIFLPQYEPVGKPAFYAAYRDKKSYFALSEEFVSSRELQKEYVSHILGHLKGRRK